MENRDNDPVVALARIMAKLYYFMADEVINVMGKEEGEEIVRRAIWKFGTNRGEGIKEVVQKKGLELNLKNMAENYDMPLSNAWDADSEVSPDNFKEIVHYCPFAEVWKELGAEELGYIYCEQDIALMKAFNENIDFSRNESLMDGDDAKCRFNIKL